MSNFIYYEKLEDYEEQVRKAKECDKKDKEIARLKEENEFLKLSNPEMNLEHWRVVDENKRKIENLRKQNKRLNEELGIRIQNSQNLVRKSDELEETIDKIEFEINNMKEIIRQQPSEDSDTDEWIINRLNGILYIIQELKGSDKE